MRVLIIGGTRNLGPSIIRALLADGHEITIFHRGRTLYDPPRGVEVLHGDRGQRADCERLVGRRDFDAVIDTTLYNDRDAAIAVDLLLGRIGQYIFISTGQVYLVAYRRRTALSRRRLRRAIDAGAGAKTTISITSNWVYGIEKRAAEDLLREAYAIGNFRSPHCGCPW